MTLHTPAAMRHSHRGAGSGPCPRRREGVGSTPVASRRWSLRSFAQPASRVLGVASVLGLTSPRLPAAGSPPPKGAHRPPSRQAPRPLRGAEPLPHRSSPCQASGHEPTRHPPVSSRARPPQRTSTPGTRSVPNRGSPSRERDAMPWTHTWLPGGCCEGPQQRAFARAAR